MGKSSLGQFEALERTEQYVVTVSRRIMLLVWQGKASADGIERSRSLFVEWVKDHPRGAVFVVVVPAKRTRAPDDETVKAMHRTANSPHPRCKGTATLLEAEGFIAASVRSIMTRLHGGGGNERAANVFGTTAEVAAWAAELLDDPEISGAFLDEGIAMARSR
jgi:hypothetical protein